MGQDAKYSNKYVKYLKNKNTKIITLSKNNEALLYKNHKLTSTIIPWDVDVDSFGELQKNVVDILGVGSLNKIKNYSTFIKVVNDLVETFPNLNVEIIGEGAIRTQLEKEIENLNLTKNITLIGELQRNQVINKMSKASVLLHTSTYESFGFVFLEALYAGMRLVSFNVGLARDMPEWQICNTEKELIEACKFFLTESIQEKKRVSLAKENNCVSSYLKLYYE
jgi:glycosyltransferase involved in cell wall biosynthesis